MVYILYIIIYTVLESDFLQYNYYINNNYIIMKQIWYILTIILILLIGLTIYYSAIKTNILDTFDTNNPKYAVCIWGQPRSIKSTIEPFILI